MAKKTELVAYCGLYCAECPVYTQTAANLAKDLRSQLRKDKFGEAAPSLAKMAQFKAFKHYGKGYELLGAIMKMRCPHNSCREGGWSPGCKIKKCAIKKRLDGCWQCNDFPTCKTLKVLEEMGDTSHLKNLRKIKRIGVAAFVRQKTAGQA
jgi:hypothetical protein